MQLLLALGTLRFDAFALLHLLFRVSEEARSARADVLDQRADAGLPSGSELVVSLLVLCLIVRRFAPRDILQSGPGCSYAICGLSVPIRHVAFSRAVSSS